MSDLTHEKFSNQMRQVPSSPIAHHLFLTFRGVFERLETDAPILVSLYIKKSSQAPYSGAVVLEPRSRNIDWLHLLLLALMCLGLFFFGLGTYGFIDRADAYYSEGTREMIETGQYFLPLLNYQVFYDKPILIYWLQLVSYSMFGITEFGARSVSAFFATALVFATYIYGTKMVGQRAGLLSSIVLASSSLVIALGRLALVDMTFCAFLTGALFLIFLRLSGRNRVFGIMSYLCLALAVLTKGPLALVLFAAVLAVYVPLTARTREVFFQRLRNLDFGYGTMTLLMVAAPWYLLAGLQTGGLWLDVFLLKGNLGRFNGETNHVNPDWWYFFPVIAYAFIPWFIYLPNSFYKTVRAFRAGQPDVDCEEQSSKALRQFLWCWTLVALIIFSASKCKLHTYMLPLIPPMAMLVGLQFDEWIARWLDEGRISRYLRACSAIVLVGGIVVLVFAGVLVASRNDPAALGRLPRIGEALTFLCSMPSDWLFNVSVSCLIVAGLAWVSQFALLMRGSLETATRLFFGAVVFFAVCCAQILCPLSYEYVNGDLHRATDVLRTREDAPIVIYSEFKPSLMFYLRRPIDTVAHLDQLLPAEQSSKLYIVCKVADLAAVVRKVGKPFNVLAATDTWVVIEKFGISELRLPALDTVLTTSLQKSFPELTILPLRAGEPPLARGRNSGKR